MIHIRFYVMDKSNYEKIKHFLNRYSTPTHSGESKRILLTPDTRTQRIKTIYASTCEKYLFICNFEKLI